MIGSVMAQIFDRYTLEQSIVGTVVVLISFTVIVVKIPTISSLSAYLASLMFGWSAVYIVQKYHPRPIKIKPHHKNSVTP